MEEGYERSYSQGLKECAKNLKYCLQFTDDTTPLQGFTFQRWSGSYPLLNWNNSFFFIDSDWQANAQSVPFYRPFQEIVPRDISSLTQFTLEAYGKVMNARTSQSNVFPFNINQNSSVF